MQKQTQKIKFGKWLKQQRRSKRLGLWRCAGFAGIGGEALRLIEAGKTNPADCKVKTLFGLARVLDLDIGEIVSRAVSNDADFMEWSDTGMRFYAEWEEENMN